MDPDIVFRIVDVTGVCANGMLGAAVARSKGFDIIGFLILAIISGLGGGMMRDVLLGVGFPVALTDPLYLSGAIAAAVIAHFLDLTGPWAIRMLVAADALVLGCWSATGASKALTFGLTALPAIFLGVLTAIGGSMLRDIMVNQTPAVFGGNPVYATISVIGASEMVISQRLGHYHLGMGIAIALCFVLAITARYRRWVLPTATQLTLQLRRPRLRPYDRIMPTSVPTSPSSNSEGPNTSTTPERPASQNPAAESPDGPPASTPRAPES